jgi:hypothetical protein
VGAGGTIGANVGAGGVIGASERWRLRHVGEMTSAGLDCIAALGTASVRAAAKTTDGV